MPKIILVVAYSQNRAIGLQNQIPWHLPNDLKHFRALTLHHRILMGRKTYESIGRSLSQREMIVLTRNQNFHSNYAKGIHSLEVLFPLKDDLYVIGGGEIYQMLLPQAKIIYATEVKKHIAGDAFFPPLLIDEWQEVSRKTHPQDEKHAFAYDFVEYQRLKG